MIYAIIPARGGSKGIPGKNIRPLNGHPVLAYSIRAAQRCKSIARTIVSTDSEEIAKVARHYGAEVPFLRPAAISGDRSTDYEFVIHALEWFREHEGKQPEILAHIRPTTPLRDPSIIDAAVRALTPGATALRSVHAMSESAYKTFEIKEGTLRAVCTGSSELDAANEARQKFPPTYFANGYIDLLKTGYILENQRIHGNQVQAFVTPQALEIDTPEDLELLEFVLQRDQSFMNLLFG